ncbi:MAG: SAP domain-containing protein [Promethearchaeia archaeon]
MQKIINILPEKTVSTLKDICRTYDLNGYSRLRKDGLINLIKQNIKNPQFKEKIEELIPQNGTTAFILKPILEGKGHREYSELREEVLKNRSNSSFRTYFQMLLSNFILFESDAEDEDIIYLPDEFRSIAEKIMNENLDAEELEGVEAEEMEGEEPTEIETLDDLLYSKKYTTKKLLKRELEKLELSQSGTKDDLIARLLYESGGNVEDILNQVFAKVDLKEICREYNLFISGTKAELIARIVERLPVSKPNSVYYKKPKRKDKTKATSSSKAKPKEVSQMASGQVKAQSQNTRVPQTEFDLSEEIFTALDDFSLDINSISKQASLESTIFSFLKNLKNFKEEFKNIEIKRDPKEPVLVLSDGENKVAITVYFFYKGRGISPQRRKISDNLLSYQSKYSKDLIYYVYDPNERLKVEDVEMFRNNIKFIYRTERQFKDSR